MAIRSQNLLKNDVGKYEIDIKALIIDLYALGVEIQVDQELYSFLRHPKVAEMLTDYIHRKQGSTSPNVTLLGICTAVNCYLKHNSLVTYQYANEPLSPPFYEIWRKYKEDKQKYDYGKIENLEIPECIQRYLDIENNWSCFCKEYVCDSIENCEDRAERMRDICSLLNHSLEKVITRFFLNNDISEFILLSC